MAKVINQQELRFAVKISEFLNSINNRKEFGTESFHARVELYYDGDYTGTVVQIDGDFNEYGVSIEVEKGGE